jgi:hypothetical protein
MNVDEGCLDGLNAFLLVGCDICTCFEILYGIHPNFWHFEFPGTLVDRVSLFVANKLAVAVCQATQFIQQFMNFYSTLLKFHMKYNEYHGGM